MKDALNAAYPDAPVPSSLDARVAARLERGATPTRRRFLAPVLATAALASLALMAAPRLLAPKPVYALEKVTQALQKIKTIHVREYIGQDRLVGEEWHSGNRHRRDTCFDGPCKLFSLTVGTKAYGVSDEKNLVTVSETNAREEIVPTLTSALKGQMLSDLPGDSVADEGEKLLGQKKVHVYKITLPNGTYSLGSSQKESVYYRLYIAPETNLPVRIEEHHTENGRWASSYKDLEFDVALPEALFDTTFPGKKLVKSSDYLTASFYQQMHQPGKRATTANNGVTVLSFPVMEALGLVVWYTIDDESALPTVTLTGKGNVCPLLAQGTVGDKTPALRERYTINGKRLRWAYFQQTFVAPMGNGDWELSFRFPEGSATLKPEIAGFGSTIPAGDAGDEIGRAFPALSGERARDRAEYFMDGRWKDDGPLVDAAVRDGFDPREGALLWLKTAIQQDEKWLAAPKHARDWRRMAEVLDQLKRHEEARSYRAKADQER